MKGRIHSFESFGAVDGPGVRYVVFFQGCPLRCMFCHNPDTWEASGGEEYAAEDVVKKILPFRNFYDNGGGVTLSGGEPLMQLDFAVELLELLKQEGLHTAIDTSAAIPLQMAKKAIDVADMLLLDFKAFDSALCEKITGRPHILEQEKEYLEYCQSTGKKVWIRHVIVPGLTLEETQLRELGAYLHKFSCVEKIEPLAFHKMGEFKWQKELYKLAATEPPSIDDMKKVSELLKSY
ncbi:MAG: pyruvate formate lyase-activating protein [Spirochaetia bacterium]|nr:pyruvate formate lyase-activating protein [Spirochaetia bacterium]